jgi:phosphoglycerol transferase
MVILWVFTDKSFLFHGNNGWNNLISKKFAISALICVLVSSAFIYYTFFSCFLLLIAGIIAYLSQRNKYPLLNSLILISVIIFGILVNMSPFLIYQIENGKNPEAVIRSPAESELYGLKIVQLLMPIGGHRIPLLANISGYYSGTAPLVNENAVASLGVIGSIGFLLLIAWAFYRISNGLMPKTVDLSSHINELSILNLSVVLLATLGGFGTLFAYLISSDIRGYNRVSIFIAFFSLFAVFLVLDAFSRKYAKSQTSRLLFNIFICIVLVFGILDQTSSSFVPPYASTKAEYLNDESFVDSIESIMPENAMIFQLPYIPFPEYPPVNRLTDYSHIRAYLHSKDLRWSYGAMKGRPGDAWQKLVAGMPVGDMLKTLSQSGFKGIYIDSYGYQDDGSKLISDIKQILGAEPLISNNQRIYFFDMTGFNKSVKADSSGTGPLFIAFNPGWHGQENWSGTQTRWMQADAGISATSFEDRAATLSMNALSFYCNRTLEISLGDEPATQVAVPTGFINVSMPIHLAKGVNTVRLRVSEGCEKPCDKPEMKTDDCRCLSLAINNITIM